MTKGGRRRFRPTARGLWAEHARRVVRALARFRTSYMSDAKCRKAFRLLTEPDLAVVGYRWKFIDDDRTFDSGVVHELDLDQRHLRDGRIQPFVYKEIEWLEVLTARPNEATAALARAGRFSVQPCGAGIRLTGYG